MNSGVVVGLASDLATTSAEVPMSVPAATLAHCWTMEVSLSYLDVRPGARRPVRIGLEVPDGAPPEGYGTLVLHDQATGTTLAKGPARWRQTAPGYGTLTGGNAMLDGLAPMASWQAGGPWVLTWTVHHAGLPAPSPELAVGWVAHATTATGQPVTGVVTALDHPRLTMQDLAGLEVTVAWGDVVAAIPVFPPSGGGWADAYADACSEHGLPARWSDLLAGMAQVGAAPAATDPPTPWPLSGAACAEALVLAAGSAPDAAILNSAAALRALDHDPASMGEADPACLAVTLVPWLHPAES